MTSPENKSQTGSFIHPGLTGRAGRTGHVLGTELKTSRRSDGGESGRRSERRESNSRAQHGRFVTRAKLVILLEPFQVQFAIGTVPLLPAKDHCNKPPADSAWFMRPLRDSSPRTEGRPVRALPDSGERGADSRSLSSGGTPQSQMRVLAGGLHAVASTRSRRA